MCGLGSPGTGVTHQPATGAAGRGAGGGRALLWDVSRGDGGAFPGSGGGDDRQPPPPWPPAKQRLAWTPWEHAVAVRGDQPCS